ncbi:hypothetical protein [Azospirillum oryzae]|uniref:hypothetical protein n=1 Tax=Azospirillum oryzae TaxID=286727 RepID=UPI000A160674|nr:hypothetical protein [Azospirillum oryzae]
MTDGPFRNSELSRQWKRYGEDLVSDAASPDERAKKALHSMFGDVDLEEFSNLLRELNHYAQSQQMDLYPSSGVEDIFERNPNSTLINYFYRELFSELKEQSNLQIALDKALVSTAKDWIKIAKDRIDDECICARDLGNMTREDYRKAILRNQEAFSQINPNDFCGALIAGNKRTISHALKKKSGVDEGPDE